MPSPTKNIREMPDGRFLVRYRYGGKEKKQWFGSRREAEDYIREEKKRISTWGKAAAEMSSKNARRIIALLEATGLPYGEAIGSLEGAYKFAKKYAPPSRSAVLTVRQAVSSLIEQWRKEGKNDVYIRNASGILHNFAKAYGDRLCSTILPAELKAWILSQSRGSQVTAKARLSALFALCRLNGSCSESPTQAFRLAKTSRVPLELPTVEEYAEYMHNAENEGDVFAAYSATRLFGGLRGAEARKVDWKHFDLAANRADLPYGVTAKKGPARTVPISSNFHCYLSRVPNKTGRIAPRGIAKLEREFRARHGYQGKIWQNGLRHGYGSYRYPVIRDINQLAQEMGNSPDVLRDHYLGVVAPSDVPKYWAIEPTQPSTSDNIL